METYRLLPHIHMCEVNGHFIFLDLKRDAYSALDRERSAALAPLVRSSPSPRQLRNGITVTPVQPLTKSVVQELLDQSILTKVPSTGKELKCAIVNYPTSLLLREDEFEANASTSAIVPSLFEVVNFFVACVSTSIELRFGTIDGTLRRVGNRKQKIAQSSEFDYSKARRLVAVFNLLRPFYHRKYLCLFDALALIEFLAKFNVFPNWVYGVKAEPFHAHCWVQKERISFNEAIEITQAYTPIMVV